MTGWLLYSLFLLVLGYVIYRHRFFHLPGLPRKATLVFFALKLVAALAVWYVYTYYYPQREYADIWKYYDDSEIIYEALDEKPGDYFRLVSGIGIDESIHEEYITKMLHWDQQFENNLFNDSHTIIRFNAIARMVSAGNYHTHSLFMCFLAFIGLCAIYRWIYDFLWQWKKVVAFLLFISPSLLFWSSGVLKEGILILALGLLIYHQWKFSEDRKKYRLLWVAVSLLLIAITKLYVLVFIVPALVTGIWISKRPRFGFLKTTLVFGLLLITGTGIHLIKPSASPYRIIAMKQRDFLNLARGGTYVMDSTHVIFISPDQNDKLVITDSANDIFTIRSGTKIMYWNIADDFRDTLYATTPTDAGNYKLLSESPVAGSLMNVKSLEPTPASVLSEVPSAFARSAFRPLPWEFKPVLVIPALLENILLFALIAAMLVWYKKPSSKGVFWFCISFVVLALTVTGLTTPVLGALVRYRITAVPFLMFAILLCINRENLLKRMPFLKVFF